MSGHRDTFKYYVKMGNKILHVGITNDLERRELEHQKKYGSKVRLKQVGNRTTREAGYEWHAKEFKHLEKRKLLDSSTN